MKKGEFMILLFIVLSLFPIISAEESCYQNCLVGVINSFDLDVTDMTLYLYTSKISDNVSCTIETYYGFYNLYSVDYSKLGITLPETVYLTIDGVRSIQIDLPSTLENYQTPNITVSTTSFEAVSFYPSILANEKYKKNKYEEGLYFSIASLEETIPLDGYILVDATLVEKKDKKVKYL